MVLSFNKDDKNVGTVSERLFAGRNSPSVKLMLNTKIYNEFRFGNLLSTTAVLG